MYAIVDIETTGGHASANGITEICVVIHDGTAIIHQYETLINPGKPIPIYIQALTGISNEMVESAPDFKEVAAEIFALLEGKIFIAHNVNFDYSFVRHHLQQAGFELQSKKLCTVRLGRKIFPGLPSYSLGKFCKSMSIELEGRHRAGGDAYATAKLFSLMLSHDTEEHIKDSLNRNSKEQTLPSNLSKHYLEKLPHTPGVYYMHDDKGKVIYVGKAKNIKKRVLSHFAGNNTGKQRQDFLKNIHSVTFNECGTELMAFILEAVEIKKLWPSNNRAMKRFEQTYGLYLFEDQKGYLRLALDKKRKHSSPLYSFNQLLEGRNLLLTLIKSFQLCPKLCFIQQNLEPCLGMLAHNCNGACDHLESTELYNARIYAALSALKNNLPTFAILDKGRSEDEQSCILIESGHFAGMGYLETDASYTCLETLKAVLTPYPQNDYIRNLIITYAEKNPGRRVNFNLPIVEITS